MFLAVNRGTSAKMLKYKDDSSSKICKTQRQSSSLSQQRYQSLAPRSIRNPALSRLNMINQDPQASKQRIVLKRSSTAKKQTISSSNLPNQFINILSSLQSPYPLESGKAFDEGLSSWLPRRSEPVKPSKDFSKELNLTQYMILQHSKPNKRGNECRNISTEASISTNQLNGTFLQTDEGCKPQISVHSYQKSFVDFHKEKESSHMHFDNVSAEEPDEARKETLQADVPSAELIQAIRDSNKRVSQAYSKVFTRVTPELSKYTSPQSEISQTFRIWRPRTSSNNGSTHHRSNNQQILLRSQRSPDKRPVSSHLRLNISNNKIRFSRKPLLFQTTDEESTNAVKRYADEPQSGIIRQSNKPQRVKIQGKGVSYPLQQKRCHTSAQLKRSVNVAVDRNPTAQRFRPSTAQSLKTPTANSRVRYQTVVDSVFSTGINGWEDEKCSEFES